MTEPLPLVSIVCPAFQEEEVLPIFHQHLCEVLKRLEGSYRFEILFVDDGSRDGTYEVLQSLARIDPRVSYLSLSRNFGHQAALTAGLEHARGDAVVSLDVDLQHPPRVIEDLLRHWREGFDVVVTIREDDKRLSWFKRFSSQAFYRVMQFLSDTEIRIAASDFRLLSRRALQALLQLDEQHRFVRGLVQWIGFRVKEISFQPDARWAGKSKYTFRRMVRLAGDGLFSFTRLPLRLPMYLAGGFLGLAFMHAMLALFRTLQESAAVGSWHYLLMSIHLGVGCLLASVGIVGEYLGRVHEQVKQRPLYLLKDCCMQPVRTTGEQPHAVSKLAG